MSARRGLARVVGVWLAFSGLQSCGSADESHFGGGSSGGTGGKAAASGGSSTGGAAQAGASGASSGGSPVTGGVAGGGAPTTGGVSSGGSGAGGALGGASGDGGGSGDGGVSGGGTSSAGAGAAGGDAGSGPGGAVGVSGAGGESGAGAAAGSGGAGGAGGTGGEEPCGIKLNEVQVQSTGDPADEFIELYNSCALPVELVGYRLVYRSAAGVADVSLITFTTGTIGPSGFFLLGGAGYLGGTPDAVLAGGGTGQLAAAGGGLQLRTPSTAVVDSLGYGTATNAFIEGTVADVPTAGVSIGRVPDGHDTNDNHPDFKLLSPTPRAINQ